MKPVDPDRVDLEALLPHRPPFLLVDRLVEVDPGAEGVAERRIAEDDPVFEGHFPGNPLYPGTLLVEIMAQAAAVVFGLPKEGEAKATPSGHPGEKYLVGIEKMRFKGMTRPGDLVRVHVKFIKKFGPISRVKARAEIDGKLVAEGELTFKG